MSIAALNWAFELELKDPIAKVVLIALADQAGEQTGHCWPSIATLTRRTGASERAIQRAINDLVDAGHVIREDRPGHSNLFHLPVFQTKPSKSSREVPLDDPRSSGTPTPVAPPPPPPQQARGTPASGAPHPRSSGTQTLIEPPLTSESAGALAPDGARPLTTREEWQRRLEGYDPHNIRATWKPFWGARPDAVGQGHLVPRDLLQWWRAQQAQKRIGAT